MLLSILFIDIRITIVSYKFLCVKAKQDDKSLGESSDDRFVLKIRRVLQKQAPTNAA